MAKVSQIRSKGKPSPPQPRGKLLAQRKDSGSAVRFDRAPVPGSVSDQVYLRAVSYKCAADLLADRTSAAGVDRTIYPTLFLCRHYVELMLKSIILEDGSSSTPAENVTSSHHLLNLWKLAKPIAFRICPTMMMKTRDEAEHRIAALHKLDETSMVFRYPVDKKLAAWSQPPLVLDFGTLRQGDGGPS